MTTKFKLVKVSDQGVQFGNAWYSHESITGYSADQLNQGNCRVTGDAYMKWLSEESPPQPIYDEAKERELFEVFAKARAMQSVTGRHPSLLYRHKDGDHEYRQSWVQVAWEGWLACAQSRAKAGEVGHE